MFHSLPHSFLQKTGLTLEGISLPKHKQQGTANIDWVHNKNEATRQQSALIIDQLWLPGYWTVFTAQTIRSGQELTGAGPKQPDKTTYTFSMMANISTHIMQGLSPSSPSSLLYVFADWPRVCNWAGRWSWSGSLHQARAHHHRSLQPVHTRLDTRDTGPGAHTWGGMLRYPGASPQTSRQPWSPINVDQWFSYNNKILF